MSSHKNDFRYMVDLVKVSKIYLPDVTAIDNISLSVNKGEIVFLTGKSGAGKTTLLRILSRIEKPTKGVVEIAGQDLGRISRGKLQKLRRNIGVAYQDFKLLNDRTVAQNIAIAMEVSYIKASVMKMRTKTLLKKLDLSDKYNSPASELSRGEQQRVAIARAFAANPDLILADEPTGNLDNETTAMVMDLCKYYNRRGTTLIIATHDESIYRDTDYRVIELKDGEIINGNSTPAPTVHKTAFSPDETDERVE